MKKLIALFSLVAFFAITVNAQTQSAKKETKTEAAKPSCCQKANKACCKMDKEAGKVCTPEQKAECAKAGKTCDHSKAEATQGK